MGVSIYYCAIPPESDFFHRLQQDKAFAILVGSFFSSYGIFEIFNENPTALNAELDEIIEENQETFGDKWTADDIIADFRTALRKTRLAHPGIEKRVAALEKTSFVVEKRLIEVLSNQEIQNASELVSELICGDQPLTPNFELDDEKALGLISASLVQVGAKIWRPLIPEDVFSDEANRWGGNDFKQLRDLYFACAERGEAIVVGVYG